MHCKTLHIDGVLRAHLYGPKKGPAAYIGRRECQLVHLWRAYRHCTLFVGLANYDPEIARMSRLSMRQEELLLEGNRFGGKLNLEQSLLPNSFLARRLQ